MAAGLAELSMHGMVTSGGRQVAGRVDVGFAVLKLRLPPVIFSWPSITTLPPLNVTLVPLPMLNVAQSIHQFPETVMVPAALQLWPVVVHRENEALGEPLVPTLVLRLSRYAAAPV